MVSCFPVEMMPVSALQSTLASTYLKLLLDIRITSKIILGKEPAKLLEVPKVHLLMQALDLGEQPVRLAVAAWDVPHARGHVARQRCRVRPR